VWSVRQNSQVANESDLEAICANKRRGRRDTDRSPPAPNQRLGAELTNGNANLFMAAKGGRGF
jgi:hypothetical protein